MEPILDLMQTVPIFAYLVPILFLFGLTGGGADRDHDPCHAANGTRDHDGAEAVPRELLSTAPMAGTTRSQMLFKVMLGGASAAARRRQPGHNALAQHGDHRLDDRRRRPRI